MVEVDLWDEPDLTADPAVGPPWIMLGAAGLCIIGSAMLLIWSGVPTGICGYALAALIAVTAVALYRYIDGRRQTYARYRPSSWARRVAMALLVAAWVVASAHAWQLATIWAKG